jgi:dTDP-D-glucose 4,6-dehydratase
MNIVTSIFDWLNGSASERDRELKSFVKSEYKHDWEYAFNTLKESRQLPLLEDRWNVR